MGKARVFSRCNNIGNINAITQKNSKIITGVTISAPSYTIDFSEVGDAIYTINNAVDNIEISLSNAHKIGQTGFIIFKFGANVPAYDFKSGVGCRPDAGEGSGDNIIRTSPSTIQLYNYYILEESKVFLHGDFTNWVQLGQDIDGEGETIQNRSGRSVAYSGYNDIIAIGAPGHSGNGINSGHVRVYKYDLWNKVWNKLGQDIDGEAAGDESGISVSLNNQGDILAGSTKNDGNGNLSGHVRVCMSMMQEQQLGYN